MLITFEGGEGVGKSTQINRIAAALRESGRNVVTTREPGGTQGGLEIRRLLTDITMPDWNPMVEYMLLLADRKHHLETLILPAISEGKWVLCDRFQDSSWVYQGWVKGLDFNTIDTIYELVTGGFWPHITFVFDASVDTTLARVASRGQARDRFESQGRAFHERVRLGYRELAKRYTKRRFVYVDAEASAEQVSQQIWHSLREFDHGNG